VDGDGAPIGEGTRRPVSTPRKGGIGLALLDTAAGVAEGAEVSVDVRGRPQPAEVVKPPFVESHVR
jgi:aminomethyltransferase